MVSGNDHVESLLNSFQAVKDVFSPFESGIRKAAKDLEHCWPVLKNGGRGGNSLEMAAAPLPISGAKKLNKLQASPVKKRSCQAAVSDEKKKHWSVKAPVKAFLELFAPNSGGKKVNRPKKGLKEKVGSDNNTCSNCVKFALTWSLLADNFAQAFQSPFKSIKRQDEKTRGVDRVSLYSFTHASKSKFPSEGKHDELDHPFVVEFRNEGWKYEGPDFSIECFIGFVFDHLTKNLHKFDSGVKERDCQSCGVAPPTPPLNWFNQVFSSIVEGKKADVNGFLGHLRFARMGGAPPSMVGVNSVDINGDDCVADKNKEETGGSSPQKLASGLLSVPLSNVERLRSTLSTVTLAELIELIPYIGKPSRDHPDKKKLFSVQDFFRYTEAEGRRFFDELDRDGDGQVTLEDLEVAMRNRKLPRRYAHEVMRRTRRNLFSKSFGWKQFLSLMEQKEPTILRAYTTLCLSKSGTLKKSEILASLENAGLPANEENAVVMMRFLNADTEESISYGHFRNFMVLLPSDRLQEDPRSIWFEAATVVAVAPPVELPATSVLKSALAGGLSCALSTSLLYPVDTIKTRVQASTQTFPELISQLPQIGVRGLYRGSIPAILGQFTSHGLRTGIFEASKLVLVNVAPNLPEIQVQSIASFCSTFLGTAVRIPCEVLKQRLQAGLFDNAGQAIVATWSQDGLKGFFRGTGATLCREVPFYVAGMGLYAESKKAAQHVLKRELEPWETIAVGALSGGLSAVITTPFDVMKTRMMTAPGGQPLSMSIVGLSILRHEGPLGLFKGAIPRFFWIAPLGAMNFAGYELAKKAMVKNEEQTEEQLSLKK